MDRIDEPDCIGQELVRTHMSERTVEPSALAVIEGHDLVNYTARQMLDFGWGATMIRALLRVVLLLIVVAAIAAFFFGYRFASRDRAAEPDRTIGTTGEPVDVDRARDAGATVGETVAKGANEVQRVAADAALTAKIKSKMTLDDTLDTARINVDTADHVVTVRGTVESDQQRQRALQLARETEGVTSVVDHLAVR